MTAVQKCESPVAAGLIAEQSSTDAQIVADTGTENKVIATLKARAALVGHQVFELAEGGFIITRWGWVRTCPDAAALAAFIAMVEGTCK